MRMRPFFTYYGGKYRIAPKYPSPIHETIIEPFCGSAGYSVRYHYKKIKLFDLNERIVSVWDYLIHVKGSEIMSLPEIFDDVRDLKIVQEAKWLIGFWCNKGSCEPRHKPSLWMRSRIRPNSQWGPAIKQRIAYQVDQIRHWSCRLISYPNVPDEKATWFIDPPYNNHSGQHYTHSWIDYNNLAKFCKSRSGQVVVCENEGAIWLPFIPFTISKSLEGSNGKRQCKEAIWVK